jgi:hypothetical protein
MGLISISKIYIMGVIATVIAYLSGQMKKDKYRKDDAVFLTTMLSLSLVGFIILNVLPRPIPPVVGLVYLLTFLPLIIPTLLMNN